MYKTILVHVDESARAAERIDLAARLAMQYDAHLVGTAMTGISPYVYPVGGFDPGMPTIVFPLEELRESADRALDLFEARAKAAGLTSFERRRLDEEAGIGMTLQARYCDVVVIGQGGPAGVAPRLRSDFPEYVLLNSVRPVLVVPNTGSTGDIGKRVTIPWNGSANAVRAITSAIPMLQRAERVELLVFNPESEGDLHGELPGADMALYLARHGVKVEVASTETSVNPGDAMLARATGAGSDVIVMGAFGHSRFREVLLGGVTKTALRSSTLPLWMAH